MKMLASALLRLKSTWALKQQICQLETFWKLYSKLLDVDVVSDQQSSESRFQAPTSSRNFQKFPDTRVPPTPQKLLHGRLEGSTHERKGETSSKLKRERQGGMRMICML